MPTHEQTAESQEFSFDRDDGTTLVIRLGGSWRLQRGLASTSAIEREITAPTRHVVFNTDALGTWDSSVLSFVTRVLELCGQYDVTADLAGLPPGLRRLVELAETVPEQRDARRPTAPAPLVERLGNASIRYGQSVGDVIGFIGEIALALGHMLRGRARYRRSDLFLTIQGCGADALGIVTLISYLVGTILAFMGAVQLQQFGAQIYVADLVGIAMVREMGAMMTGIIMAGRTGAAFAAQLGSMKVRQEIDALNTMGIWPLEFLVLPRLVALVLMMPLLCLYSDVLGILGGATVGVGMLHLSFQVYMQQTFHAISLTGVIEGLFKAMVYGVLIAVAGCLRGFQCGDSASSVGEATTSAVVTGIVSIVAACGIFALVFNIVGL